MKILRLKTIVILFYAALIIHLYPLEIFPQKMSIPVRIQAATFSKIFKYNTLLKGKNPIKLLIVFDKNSRSEKDQFISAFKKTAIKISVTTPDKIEQNIDQVDVVYFMPGLHKFTVICRKKKKLSISGVSKYAENGNVSIALGLVQDKPRLFVNMDSLLQEGHSLSANLLKISKMFRGGVK